METDIAIQQDATQTGSAVTAAEDSSSVVTGFVSPREAAMAAIEEQVTKSLQDQGVVFDDATSADDTSSVQPPAAASVTTDPQTAERTIKVKIDGVEQELPESEVVKGFQKDSAASRRLEEAAHRLKEIEERERVLQEAEQRQPEPPATDINELARNIVNGIVEGNVDDTVEMLARALSSTAKTTSTPVVDESQVKAIVDEQLIQTAFEADFAKAKEMFDTTYADINSNPRLAQLCNDIYFEQINAGKKPSEAAKTAGDEVRSLFPTTPPPTVISTRQERKQNIDNINPAATTVAVSTEQEAPNDPAAVIAEMKRARGQT